jgi:DNA-directed RNA polymerase II subunit RPB1
MLKTKNRDTNVSKIIGIQFSILSPEEIENSSVAEITNRDTYVNNKPVLNGLFDPRMGILEPGFICPTDGLDYIQTPGYFGHIKLSKPVFYIQYLPTILKILRCVCIKCSKLLIDKEKYCYLCNNNNDERWNKVFNFANKIKRCGEDSLNGCGCLQPKLKKEGLATIVADWTSSGDDENKVSIKLSPETIINIFKKISDEDVNFMGFSSLWSRPEWMICQVMAVPPPSVRPSVKHNSQQRSEDDLTHILVNIIKSNKTLQEKIEQNANPNIIEDWATVLQYYVSTLVDNKIPGVAAVAQRSGRPLKAVKERLNGKTGRVRGNLMGKRVDFSARSVITPDPNLSISELGIPLKIAKNLTKPITVNDKNKNYLTTLILNGPDEYPGAKIYERKNGDCISLKYTDRESIVLEVGDIVHRHILDGDSVLFNRQPTLHRMSMMCHSARIMFKGDTFRMNVGDTKPYNADFDGDEMNLHMPQDEESEIELKMLAVVKNQIISPANNKSIVGIFQDSLLSTYIFTNKDVVFDSRTSMNLLMHLNKIDLDTINFKNKTVSNFDILSQIFPNISIKYKTKRFEDNEDYNTSNNILEIKKGKLLRGNIDKNVLGDTTRGLLQRIYNDYNEEKSRDFIDDLQNIVTEFMKLHSYSVGISDLIADEDTNNKISEAIYKKKIDVNTLIDELHLGIFENKTGKSNIEEFETKVNNILNKASFEAGKIGRKNLDTNNRFVIMVNAGSKGSDLNISQMISCLGQQNVDGKRIPYGFDNRTLPHFTKFNDTPEARGFVESSFISGLRPEELFFHAMGGRVGLIDTAVKTSQTGYIQRRIIKALEDIKVEYDMTVRNNKGKIIQYNYGDDNFDPVYVENQQLPFINMKIEEVYGHYHMPNDSTTKSIYSVLYSKQAYTRFKKQKKELDNKNKEYIDYILTMRKKIITNIFKNISNSSVNMPVSFVNIINNIAGNQNENVIIDVTPLEVYEMIENNIKIIDSCNYIKSNDLFKTLYYYYLSPKELLMNKKLTKKSIEILLNIINLKYNKSIVAPGEMVGMIAAQSVGEPTTQLTLNTFHFAGVASKSNVTRGVPRIEEILSLSEKPKNPSCTIYFKNDERFDEKKATDYINEIENTILNNIVKTGEICFDPSDKKTQIENDKDIINEYNDFEDLLDTISDKVVEKPKENSKWIIRLLMNKVEMLDKNITMEDVYYALTNAYPDIIVLYEDYNSDNLIFRIRLTKIINNIKKKKNNIESLDQADEIYLLKTTLNDLLNNVIIRGVKNINKALLRKINDTLVEENLNYVKKDEWVLDTVGSNLMDLLSLDFVDSSRTTSNSIIEIYNVLGVEAARQSIYDEFSEVIEFDSTYINYHHLSILCDRMSCNNKLVSVFRHGINNDNIGPIAKASFEETPEMFLKAARHGELDMIKGISSNIMCGQEGYYGTSSFKTLLDLDKLEELNVYNNEETEFEDMDINEELEKTNVNSACNINNLLIETDLNNLQYTNIDINDDYDVDF